MENSRVYITHSAISSTAFALNIHIFNLKTLQSAREMYVKKKSTLVINRRSLTGV